MKINRAKDAIKELYKTNSVTALISERGVGKTSVYKQCTKELDIGYIDLYAAALEGPDFMGLPDKNRDIGVTQYLAPSFLPTVEAIEAGIFPKAGILVLEEINRVSSDTISVLYPLLLDRKINGHVLAPDWKIGVTMNPDNMNYFVNTLDDAMLDRFISILIEPDIVSYTKYSKQTVYNSDVLSFLETYPDMLLVVNKDSSALSKSPTPRGWTRVQEILNSCNLDKYIIQEIIAGIIGPVASSSFIGYLENNSDFILSTDDLLKDYNLVSSDIIKLVEENRAHKLTNIILSIISKISSDENCANQLNKFLNDLPSELQILFFKEIYIKKPDVLSEISEYLDSFEEVTDTIIDLIAG